MPTGKLGPGVVGMLLGMNPKKVKKREPETDLNTEASKASKKNRM
jgi:hypothetical protein